MKIHKKILLVLLLTLSSLELVFNVISYSLIFYVIDHKQLSMVFPFTLLVIAGYAFFQVVEYYKEVTINQYIKEKMVSLKRKLLKHKLEEYTLSNKNIVTDNISFFQNDLSLYEENYLRAKLKVYSVLITAGVTFCYSLFSNVFLTLIFIIFAAIPHLFSNVLKSKISKSTDEWTDSNKNFTKSLTDFFQNIWTIKVYNVKKKQIDRINLDSIHTETKKVSMKNNISLSQSFQMIIGYTCMFTPIGIGIYLTIKGNIPLATFVAIQYSSSWIMNSLMGAFKLRSVIQSTAPIRNEIEEIVTFSEEVETHFIEDKINCIEFKDVIYEVNDKTIFSGLSFTLNTDEKILIQGPSGSGKTTLLQLVTKQIRPKSGSIYINNTDLSKISTKEILKSFSIIQQTPSLFNESILQNLTLGKSFTDSQIQNAVAKAGLNAVVEERGLDYVVGESGKLLSGGEAKRVEIARAILFDRDIFIIDEAISSLDVTLGTELLERLLAENKLTIDIEHHINPETREKYDKVIQL